MSLNKREEKILRDGLEDIRTARSKFLKEDEELIKREHPGPGFHVHDKDNPLGLHRHNEKDSLDGPHVHSPQNPTGEHVHGEFAGKSLIDGAHAHDEDDIGWHHHKSDDREHNGEIVPQEPELELPDTDQDVTEE